MKLNSPEKNPIIRLILTLYIFIYVRKFQKMQTTISLRISVIKIVYICNFISHIFDNCCCCSVTVVSNSLRHHRMHMPGLPVPHHLLKFAQVHVHCVVMPSTASSPDTLFFSHSPSFPTSGTFSLCQLSHQMIKTLEFQLQRQSFEKYSGLILWLV